MTTEAFLALSLFAFVSSITPGPNNLMLLASGVNFGFRRTVPHMLGITFGFTAMIAILGLGVGAVISASPVIHTGMNVACGLYLLWLAWKLATSASLGSTAGDAHPMTFVQGALFQWINPKAWAMALTATALWVQPEAFFVSVFLIAFIFGAINLPSVGCWAMFGMALRGFLSIPSRLRAFNIAMAVLLVVSTAPFLLK